MKTQNTFLVATIFFCTSLILSGSQLVFSQSAPLPDMVRFNFITKEFIALPSFSVSETKLLPGISAETNADMEAQDKIGNLAVAGVTVDNHLDVDGRYNHNDYKVEKGILKDQSGRISFEAYKVYEPSKKASEFLGSFHGIFFKFPTQENYTVYSLDANKQINKMGEIKAEQIDTGKYTKIGLMATNIVGSRTFFFVPSSQEVAAANTKILPGISKETDNDINADDKIGNLAIAGVVIDNHCDVDGRYNHNDFKVEQGILKDKAGKMVYEAYKVYEPTKKASEFLVRFHGLFFKFPTKEDYLVYALDGERITQVGEVKAEAIDTEKYTEVNDVLVTNIVGSRIFFFAPSGERVSVFTTFSESGEGAKIADTPMGSFGQYRHWMGANLYDIRTAPTVSDYHSERQFFPFKEKDNKVSLMWQDTQTLDIFLTTFGADLKSEKTVKMSNNEGEILYAAINTPERNYYYITVKKESLNKELPKNDIVTIHKASGNYDTHSQFVFDSSEDKLNVFDFWGANLEYQNGKVYMMYSRVMNPSQDGLKHQAASMMLLNGEDFKQEYFNGLSTSHCFDDLLIKNKENDFVGVHLGDGYPRGIRVHKFKNNEEKWRVVYTMKYDPENGTVTYTELGGLLEATDGYITVFAGEASPEGKALDASRLGEKSDPRNIGFIKMKKEFNSPSTYDSAMIVSDATIISKGISEEGGFKDGSNFVKQRNTGVIWLTKYFDKKQYNIHYIKAAFTKDGNILILWENQKDGQYENTYAMKVDTNGKILVPPFQLGNYVRLDRRNNVLNLNGKTIIFSGDGKEQKWELTVLDF